MRNISQPVVIVSDILNVGVVKKYMNGNKRRSASGWLTCEAVRRVAMMMSENWWGSESGCWRRYLRV